MTSIWVLFTLGLSWKVSGQLLPLTTKQDGSVDMSILVNHITRLETDLQMTKSDLQTTKSDLKDQQRRSDAEISSLKDELATVKTEVVMTSDELTSAKSEVATLKTKILSLQASMNQSMLDSISLDVKSNMADIKSVNHTLETTNSSLENFVNDINNLLTQLNTTTSDINLIKSDVATIRRNIYIEIVRQVSQILPLKTKTVAFSAKMKSGTLKADLPVKFDNVQYNEGNGYNKTTGVFTAPVSGTYMFSVQVELYDTSKPQATYLYIMKSGSLMASGFGASSAGIDDITIPVTTVMYVGQGEEVWIQSLNNVKVGGVSANHFVGALVFAY